MDRLLVLVRHGQSDWNLKNLFTGWKDPGLTDLGVEEAREAGRRLEGARACRSTLAFTSVLSRAAHPRPDARGARADGSQTIAIRP